MHRPLPPVAARPEPRRWLNLGVLAHVDAGKTSLTEALLHAGGALDHVGSVDAGTTRTDTLALERRRGITIRTAVASFTVGDVTVNLIDTPGHPDFIAEVDRSLAVLDGAVLVLSSVEGVQAQTIVLYRALRRLGVPIVFFVNKIDRSGADPDRVVAAVRRRLGAAVVPLGTVAAPGTAAAHVVPPDLDDPAVADDLTARLADHDQQVLEAWVDRAQGLDRTRFAGVLGDLTRRGQVSPLCFGSAITGAGVDALIQTLTAVLPCPPTEPGDPLAGQVFKIERSDDGERVSYVRLRAGTLAVRDAVVVGDAPVGKVTGLEVSAPAGFVRVERATAGQVVRLHGLTARLGDRLGVVPSDAPTLHFAAPALETTIHSTDPERQGDLHRALTQLADIDPLIRLRTDDRGSLRISLYGEIQQQVIADTLALGHGIEVGFAPTMISCVERLRGTGRAVRRIGDPDHHWGSTLGVTVAPAEPGSGTRLDLAVPRTDQPLHVYATPDGFRDALIGYLDGPLSVGPHGWPVVDVDVTVAESDYNPPGPTPADVRHTVGIVVAEAIRRAGTVVCEPVERFRLETPTVTTTAVLGLLARHRAELDVPELDDTLAVVGGMIPTAELDPVRRALHGVTHGEGLLESWLDHYTALPDHATGVGRSTDVAP